MPEPTTFDYITLARDIVATLEETYGDCTPEIEEAMHQLWGGAPSKLEALFHVQRRLQMERDLLLAERERIDQRREGIKAHQDRVKDLGTRLLMAIRETGGLADVKDDGTGGRIRTPTLTVWLQRNPPSVQGPDDLARWPAKWKRTKTEEQPNRKAALAELKEREAAGDELPPGFSVNRREGIRWR